MSEKAPTKLLFVCSGNICRSPLAEGIARAYALERNRNIVAKSAGTLHILDRPADPKAVAVAAEIEVDIEAHRSQGITQELVDWSNYTLVMEYMHAEYIRDQFENVGELLMLGGFAGRMEIADPIGGWKFRFRRSRDEIDLCVKALIDRLPAD